MESPAQIISQAYIQSFELVRPNIYPIYKLLEHVKGLFLQIHDTGQQQDVQEESR